MISSSSGMCAPRCGPDYSIIGFCLLLLLSGCAGVQTFPNLARSGDTVALAAGWKQNFSRDDLTVTITAADGVVTTYPPGDPSVRAIVNFYPDPLSSLLVSEQSAQDLTPYVRTYADMIDFHFTGGDPDWWQTTVFIDLPDNMSLGAATVMTSSVYGESATSSVEIIPGDGSPAVFNTELNGPLASYQLAALERVEHYVVQFHGETLPYAIQIDFSHDPDADHGGAGRAHVVNARGDIKGIAWSGNGEGMRVLLMPTHDDVFRSFADFKFYVAGGVTGLAPHAFQAFDSLGNPVPGVTVEVVSGN